LAFGEEKWGLAFLSEPLESQLGFARTDVRSVGCSCRTVSHGLLCLACCSGIDTRRSNSGRSDLVHFDLSYVDFWMDRYENVRQTVEDSEESSKKVKAQLGAFCRQSHSHLSWSVKTS
jgi:hypothetical protein